MVESILIGLGMFVFGILGITYYFDVMDHILERDAITKTTAAFMVIFGIIAVIAGLWMMGMTVYQAMGGKGF